MLPLNLCRFRGFPSAGLSLRPHAFRLLGLAIALGCLLPGVRLLAQESDAREEAAPPAAPLQLAPVQPPINFRERPTYPTDSQRLRRTVQLDGVLSDGEWDPFYTVTGGPIKGTIYCNWDDNFLYLAARTEQPAVILFDVDMGGDGWLRGADNLELVIGSVPESGNPALVARLLNAANSKDAPAWNETATDTRTIQVAGKAVNGTQFIEIAIPKNTASLVLRPGATLGLRAEFLPPGLPSAYLPTQPFEPHLLLDAMLVESRALPASGVLPRLTLSDHKCVATQKLFATLELRNQRDLTVPIRSVTWTGQGNSINAVNTIRSVNVPSIPGLKTLKLKYDTVLPPDLAPGSYTLLVTVDLEDGKQVQSAATFTVVEPLQAQISSDPQPVEIVGQTKLQLNVDVYSAVPNHFRGDVEIISMPAGWELEGGKKRSVGIDREDARRVTRYNFKLPSTTQAGDYPFDVNVSWRGRVWNLKHTVHVTRTEAPSASAPAPPAK